MFKKCSKCNIALEEKYCFCPSCGKKLEPHFGKVINYSQIRIPEWLQYLEHESKINSAYKILFLRQYMTVLSIRFKYL